MTIFAFVPFLACVLYEIIWKIHYMRIKPAGTANLSKSNGNDHDSRVLLIYTVGLRVERMEMSQKLVFVNKW